MLRMWVLYMSFTFNTVLPDLVEMKIDCGIWLFFAERDYSSCIKIIWFDWNLLCPCDSNCQRLERCMNSVENVLLIYSRVVQPLRAAVYNLVPFYLIEGSYFSFHQVLVGLFLCEVSLILFFSEDKSFRLIWFYLFFQLKVG